MTLLAVIDASRIQASLSPATTVAGLSLVERAIRLANISDAHQIIVCIPSDLPPPVFDISVVDTPVVFWSAQDPTPDLPDATERILILDAQVIYQRSLVSDAVAPTEELKPDQILRHADGHLAILSSPSPHTLSNLLANPRYFIKKGRPTLSGGWTELIDSEEAITRAERRLWNGCRKAQDGLVSRYLNRHLSIAISRTLVSTWVKPNHITMLTFSLGIASALFAGWGGYLGFLIAGILYQLNSIIDGVDGELARVRYEFSVTGEWLDTISDDMSDLLLYIGLGIGAWQTMPDAPGPFGSETWLILGLIAAFAKIASMVVYYRWLIAHGRGDLLAFEWSFKDDSEVKKLPKSGLARALSMTHYFFRKDFIVFVAMILSFGGFLPHLLFALAPGNLIVAISVVVQQARRN